MLIRECVSILSGLHPERIYKTVRLHPYAQATTLFFKFTIQGEKLKAENERLFGMYTKLRKYEDMLGLEDIAGPSKLIFAFISNEVETTIAKVNDNAFFKNVSLSTIKRSVTELLNNNLIVAHTSKYDLRERVLKVKETH
jgi:hypothetical protein